ncbi:uncharacterized protein LOC5518720 isoform X1 [Nematostella vectensis]|uniref:uncharacterized protein LOC5518720 isoform X1 n=1 Tax=Nematostella vectensis TaxID=45351 RepID=UPI002076F3ED|nr:uncharacterized protein LOC5518720 isoform X1 [Nematostella vectensis]
MSGSHSDKYNNSLLAESKLHHKHDEILAKRELLLASGELLEKNRTKNQKTIKTSFINSKARNDQIVQELEATHKSLKKRTNESNDPTFLAMRNNYMGVVEKESPIWLARAQSDMS